MTASLPTVSVVILSHRRPHLLKRVVQAIRQLDYPAFELVVVGDQPDIGAYDLPPDWGKRIRYDRQVEPNICKARNMAVRLCAGEIVAFCDDDAVPEPDWLRRLMLPFANTGVAAVAGTVRAADGMTIEWQGGHFDRTGAERQVHLQPGLQIVDADSQIATSAFLGLMGVNTAFRRAALVQIGGFDEAIRYYLDETDLALRLAESGWSAALAPSAEVHHLREANAARCGLRVPRNLFEIAASKAYFCRRHLPGPRVRDTLQTFRDQRVRDLDPYIRLGMLRHRERMELTAQVDAGLQDGLSRTPELPLMPDADRFAFQPFVEGVSGLRLALVSGWGVGRILGTRRLARTLFAQGHMVSCFIFHSGAHSPSVRYEDGVWLHRGGTWRDTWRGRATGRAALARKEIARVQGRRRFDMVLHVGGRRPDGAETMTTPHLRAPLHVRPTTGAVADAQAMLLRLARDLQAAGATVPDTIGEDRDARLNSGPDAFVGYSQGTPASSC